MTTESCTKKQLKVDDGSSDTETAWADEKINIDLNHYGNS
jgi:hypothetical protein